MIDHGAVSFHLTYSFSVVCGGDETLVIPAVRVCRDILPLPIQTSEHESKPDTDDL